jgi:regulator of RNase E activity RraA
MLAGPLAGLRAITGGVAMLEKTRRSPETGLARFGTATIHEAQGRVGAVHASIRPIDPAMRVLGTAFTVRCQPGDNLALHYALT